MANRPIRRLSELSEGGGDNPKGLKCRQCGCCNFEVYRTVQANGFIQRERHCRNCGERLLTREIPLQQ